MTAPITGGITAEDWNEAKEFKAKLLDLYREAKIKAGSNLEPIEAGVWLDETRKLKAELDQLRFDEMFNDTKKLETLSNNLAEVKKDLQASVAKLEDMVQNLKAGIQVAMIIDDAVKIAAGLSKSL